MGFYYNIFGFLGAGLAGRFGLMFFVPNFGSKFVASSHTHSGRIEWHFFMNLRARLCAPVDGLKTCSPESKRHRLFALMAEPVNYVVVSRRRPRDMRYATRTAAIFVGEVQEQDAFQREMTDALSFCFLDFMSKRERNFVTCIIAGEMAENFHRYLCPQIISLPFRREYRGAISAHADSVCHAEFRFNKMQLRRLHIALRLDGDHRLDNGAKYYGETILLVSLFYTHRPMTQEECDSLCRRLS
jgi:hypothetical protein